jgi:hypothetical protein
MAEKTAHDETTVALRARIKQLEAALDREREANRSANKRESGSRSHQFRNVRSDVEEGSRRVEEGSRRVADSATSVTRRARDGASRTARASKLAAFEGLRAFSDSVTSFADAVISRSEGSDRNVRDLITDLPGDIAAGFADAFDNFVDVPSRAADRFSRSYREGSDTPARKRSSNDDEESPTTHSVHVQEVGETDTGTKN